MHIEACKRRLFLIGWLPNISPPFYTPESVLMDCVCPEHVHLHFVSLMNVLIPQKRSLSKTWKLLVNKINTDTVMIWGLWLKKNKKNFNFRLLHLSYSRFLKKCQCCQSAISCYNLTILSSWIFPSYKVTFQCLFLYNVGALLWSHVKKMTQFFYPPLSWTVQIT